MTQTTHRPATIQRYRFVLLGCSFLLHAAVFTAIYLMVSHSMGVAGVIPAIVGGWLFGLRGGIVCGVLAFPVTCLMSTLLGVPDWMTRVIAQAIPGHLAVVLVGVVVGCVHDLSRRLRRDLELQKKLQFEVEASQQRFRAIAESTPDAVITADSANQIIFWNPGAETMFGYAADEIVGKGAESLIPERFRCGECRRFVEFTTGTARDFTGKTFDAVARRRNGEEFFVEQSLSTWQAGGERFFTSVIRDISERKRIEQEREQLIVQLQQALADIKTLSGLVPICSCCKRIRDDDGFWSQIEAYVSAHTHAQFSHSICPACVKKLYPDMCDEKGDLK